MTKAEKQEDILDRYHNVIAERSLYFDFRKSDTKEHWGQLSKIAKLILNELTAGNHPRHIMFLSGGKYDYHCE